MNVSAVLSSLRNAGLAKKPFAFVSLSNVNIRLLDILYTEGLISGYFMSPCKKKIRVQISYLGFEIPLVSSLKTISRPGRKVYLQYADLIKCYSGRFLILSTDIGIITGTTAIKARKGGEFISLRYYFQRF